MNEWNVVDIFIVHIKLAVKDCQILSLPPLLPALVLLTLSKKGTMMLNIVNHLRYIVTFIPTHEHIKKTFCWSYYKGNLISSYGNVFVPLWTPPVLEMYFEVCRMCNKFHSISNFFFVAVLKMILKKQLNFYPGFYFYFSLNVKEILSYTGDAKCNVK
jgi:hypothetical protein